MGRRKQWDALASATGRGAQRSALCQEMEVSMSDEEPAPEIGPDEDPNLMIGLTWWQKVLASAPVVVVPGSASCGRRALLDAGPGLALGPNMHSGIAAESQRQPLA